MADRLSDKALAVFAFAAYHQLTSGETVKEVTLTDSAGHRADSEAIKELKAAGLLDVSGDRGSFTDSGQLAFEKILTTIRSALAQ